MGVTVKWDNILSDKITDKGCHLFVNFLFNNKVKYYIQRVKEGNCILLMGEGAEMLQ